MLNLNEGINQAYTNLLKEELNNKEIYSLLDKYGKGTEITVTELRGYPYFYVDFPNGKSIGISTELGEVALMKKTGDMKKTRDGYEITYDDGMFYDVVRFYDSGDITEILDYMSKDNDEQIQEDSQRKSFDVVVYAPDGTHVSNSKVSHDDAIRYASEMLGKEYDANSSRNISDDGISVTVEPHLSKLGRKVLELTELLVANSVEEIRKVAQEYDYSIRLSDEQLQSGLDEINNVRSQYKSK